MDKALHTICLKSLETVGKQSCVMTAIEELGELVVALSQFENRGKGTIDDVITEIADVELMCAQLRIIYGDKEVDEAKVRQTKKWVTQLSSAMKNKPELIKVGRKVDPKKNSEEQTIEKLQKKVIKSFNGSVPKKPKVGSPRILEFGPNDEEEADLIEAQRLAEEEMIRQMGDFDPHTGEIKRKAPLKPKGPPRQPEVFVFDPDEPDGTFLYQRR